MQGTVINATLANPKRDYYNPQARLGFQLPQSSLTLTSIHVSDRMIGEPTDSHKGREKRLRFDRFPLFPSYQRNLTLAIAKS